MGRICQRVGANNIGDRFRPADTTMSDSSKLWALLLAVMMVTSVVAGTVAFTGTVSASQSSTVTANPAGATDSSTHTVSAVVESNDDSTSLNEFEVDYSVDGNFDGSISNVDQSDIKEAYIIRDDANNTRVNVSDDIQGVSASNNGETLLVSFGGSYQLYQNDTVVVKYHDVRNPSNTGN